MAVRGPDDSAAEMRKPRRFDLHKGFLRPRPVPDDADRRDDGRQRYKRRVAGELQITGRLDSELEAESIEAAAGMPGIDEEQRGRQRRPRQDCSPPRRC